MAYDKICIGRYTNILVYNSDRCNARLQEGMSLEDYKDYEINHYDFYDHHKTPHLVIEYYAGDKLYRRALKYPRNSPIIQKAFFGREVVVVYDSSNPFVSEIKKDLSVEEVIAQYNMTRPVYAPLPYQKRIGHNSVDYKSAYTSLPSNKTPLILAILSIVPFAGPIGLILAIIAIILGFNELKKGGTNHNTPVAGIVIGIVSITISLFVIGAFIAVLANLYFG